MPRPKSACDGGTTTPAAGDTDPLTRRTVLQVCSGLGVTGAVGPPIAGTGTAASHRPDGQRPTPYGDESAATWMTEDVPEKPLREVCLPGTHHAPMHDCGENYWWHCQSRDMGTQLSEGIRFLDVRPGAYYDHETLVDAGIADELSAEWTALDEAADGIANILPPVEGVDESLLGLLESLLDLDDPDWVARQYVDSCRDAGDSQSDQRLSLETLLLRTLVSLFAREEFDVPTYGLDLDTMRLDRPADVDVEMDDFRAHHGGQRANPYDWGESLTDGFGRVGAYLESVAARGAAEIVIVHNRYFWDLLHREFTPAAWSAYVDLLTETLGDYLLDLGEYDPEAFAALSPADLDGPRVAVLMDGPGMDPTQRPSWAGSEAYLQKFFGGATQPPHSLHHAISHTAETPHGASDLSWVEWQVTADQETMIDVTVQDVNPFDEFDDRLMYTDLQQAAVRTNALLGGYVETVRRNPDQNPNLLSLDYYESSALVAYCRDLTSGGFINGDATTAGPPVPEGTYRLRSLASGGVVTAPGQGNTDTSFSKATGDGCELDTWTGSPSQQFELRWNDDFTARLQRVDLGQVLTVDGARTANGDAVCLAPWEGGDHQRWYVVDLDDIPGYGLFNPHSGRALDGARGYDGVTDGELVQFHAHLGTNQRWSLESRPEDPPPVTGTTSPRDPDGDWLYEDVRGDGVVDIYDVQTLFSNLDSPVVQNNARAFDFSGENRDTVTIADVQALFNRLTG